MTNKQVEAEFALAEEAIREHANIVVRTDTMDRLDWLRTRKIGLGSADAAPSLGLSKAGWGGPLSTWADKISDEVSDDETERQKWGRRLEEPVGLGIAEDIGLPVRRFPYMLQSIEWPFMTANLDFIAPRSNVEVKLVDRFMAYEWDDGAVPMHYTIQGQHANAVTGQDGTHFLALIGGNTARAIYVARNDALIESLVEAERQFWKLVEDQTPPDVDGLPSTTEALKRLYVDPEAGAEVELPGEAVELIAQRATVKAAMAEQKLALDEIENQLRLWLGRAEIGTVNGTTVVTWKQSDYKGYYVEPRTSRRFNFPKAAK
jgi:predicted phage-related endonuclease